MDLTNARLSGVLPVLGGLAVLAVFLYGLTTQSAQVSVVAGVLVVACVVAAVPVRMLSRATYFSQQSAVHEVEARIEVKPS